MLSWKTVSTTLHKETAEYTDLFSLVTCQYKGTHVESRYKVTEPFSLLSSFSHEEVMFSFLFR